MAVNLVNSLPKGKLEIVSVSGSSEEVVCEAPLNLEELSLKDEKEHEIELQYKKHPRRNHQTYNLVLLS